MKIIISKTQQYFSGHVIDNNQLIASILPRKSELEVKNSLLKLLFPLQTKSSVNPDKIKISKKQDKINAIIYGIFTGDKDSWEMSKKIRINYLLVTHKEKKVLEAVRRIPYGKVASYQKIAEIAGIPKASRFVGNTMAKNPFAPIIPCHRVVKKNGLLGNYGLGVNVKKQILELEGITLKKKTSGKDSSLQWIISEKSFI